MELRASLLDDFVGQILELSAAAHVRKRVALKDSQEFCNLNGAIAAYAKVLALIGALRCLEDGYAKAGELSPATISESIEKKSPRLQKSKGSKRRCSSLGFCA